MHHPTTLKHLVMLVAAIALSSCSDSSLQESGGGAGDGDNATDNPEALALVLPFVGLYDLQDDWNGRMGDQAFLSILEPETTGIAEARLIDFDDIDNCVPGPVLGDVGKDLFSDRIFLNSIPELNESVLTLSGNTLTIELADESDRNGNGDTTEIILITAERIGQTEMDLGVACF